MNAKSFIAVNTVKYYCSLGNNMRLLWDQAVYIIMLIERGSYNPRLLMSNLQNFVAIKKLTVNHLMFGNEC